MSDNKPVLEVKNLKTYFDLDEGLLKAVDDVSFEIGKNETLGIIGESGCGKSVTAQSVIRIEPEPGRIVSGEIILRREGEGPVDLAKLSKRGEAIRKIRGRQITMIFQEPMTSLSPVHTIGNQITELIQLHKTENKKEAIEHAVEMLEKVRIPDPRQRIDSYPHELSGGLRQRAMIAMALSCNPILLIADEPTTALDVTVQAQILQLMRNLQDQFGMSIMYITHNLGVISEVSDHVAVMYLGKIAELGTKHDVFADPLHPYTRQLFKSIPKAGRKAKEPLEAIKGTVPLPIGLPEACPFVERCPEAMSGVCDTAVPSFAEVRNGHWVRCFLHPECEPEKSEADTATPENRRKRRERIKAEKEQAGAME